MRLAIMRLSVLLTDFDPAVLKPKLSEQPGCYARILNALCKLADGDLKLQKHRDDHARIASRAQRQRLLDTLAP